MRKVLLTRIIYPIGYLICWAKVRHFNFHEIFFAAQFNSFKISRNTKLKSTEKILNGHCKIIRFIFYTRFFFREILYDFQKCSYFESRSSLLPWIRIQKRIRLRTKIFSAWSGSAKLKWKYEKGEGNREKRKRKEKNQVLKVNNCTCSMRKIRTKRMRVVNIDLSRGGWYLGIKYNFLRRRRGTLLFSDQC